MPFTTANNDAFFDRVENLAKALQSAREEAKRLKEVATQFQANLADPSDGDHTLAELLNFRDNILLPFIAFVENGAVTTRDRVADLQEWLH